MKLIRKFKNAPIAAKLIISFALIIALFVGEIIISYIATNEIVTLHEHNSYFMQGRHEVILEFHQTFTEKRFFVRDSFMSFSWRQETEPDVWREHQVMLSTYIDRLDGKADRFIYLIDSDDRFPRGGDKTHRYIMHDVMREVHAIYDNLRHEFFLGSAMTFNAHEAINNAENIEQMLSSIHGIIDYNRALVLAYVDRTQRFIAILSLGSIIVASMLAASLAVVMVRSFNKKIKNIESSANLVARGEFDESLDIDTDEISTVFAKMVGVFKQLISEINGVYNEREHGNADARIDTSLFEGGHKNAALVINNLLDQAEMLKAKEADSDMRMRRMYESTPLLIEYWDEDYNLIDCNPYVVKFFGIESKEDYIKNVDKVFPEYQPDGSNTMAVWQKNLTLIFKGVNTLFELVFTKSNGEMFYAEIGGYKLEIGDERYAVTYARDITHSKQVEKERERAKIAEESSEAKSRFLANMSHEIRTPISAVMGISEIQLQNSSLPIGVQEAFSKIFDSSRVLLNIINDILDISKVEAGKMPIIVEKYEVASLVGDMMQLNLVYLGSKQIKFETIIDENMPAYLYGDELRIKQIINNLISNAFKYTDFGSVIFDISCEDVGELEEGEKTTLVVVVSDTGRGMSKRQLEALKEEYTRFHEEASRTTQGTGLGMAIVSKMIGLMDGEISIESVVDVGTIVTVKIPQGIAGSERLGKETAESLRKHDPSTLGKKQKNTFSPVPMPYGNVLVVDDVDTNLYVAKSLLNFYELKIETVSSGYAAIDKISAGNVYDIIFMDHMMPGMDGMEATKIIRSDGYTGAIVALTANALIGQAEEFMKNGFDGFISKPIQTMHLDSILHKFIKDKHYPELVDKTLTETEEFSDYMQNSEILHVVYREFLDTQKTVAADIRAALATDDLETAQRIAHTLKGLAGLISADALADISALNEKNFKGKTVVEDDMKKLEYELDRTLAGIAQLVSDE